MSDWVETTLGAHLNRIRRKVAVEHGVDYPAVSVTRDGAGLGEKEPFIGGVTNYANLFRVAEGDVVVRTITAFESPAGVAHGEHDGTHVSGVFLTYEVANDALPGFFELFFQTPMFWREMQNRATGTVLRRKTISDAAFCGIPVALPPLAEQRRIVDVMAAVDAQIEALADEVEGLANTTAVLRANYPDSDEVDLASVLLGIDSGKSVQTDGEEPRPDEARILKLSAVRPGRFDAREAKRLDGDVEAASFSSSHLVSEGDLLVTRANTPERVGYVVVARSVPARTYMPDLIWRARVDQKRASAEYLGHVLSSPEFRRRITGTAGGTSTSMVKINKKGFGGVRVPIPLLEAQNEYVAKCDAAQRLEQALASELANLRMFRSTLLTALLSQEIVIPECYDDLLETL